MKKNGKMKTAAYLLLDRSGSMSTLWEEALGSLNGYVPGLPADSRVVLATFDSHGHEFYEMIRNTTAGDWEPITNRDAQPRGGTPLFDASARMMWGILHDNPDRAVFVTMTDGEENASKHFKQTDIKNLVIDLEKKDYQVVFLGANFDKVGDTARQYGVDVSTRSFNMARGTMAGSMGQFAAQSTNYMTTGASIDTSKLNPNLSGAAAVDFSGVSAVKVTNPTTKTPK